MNNDIIQRRILQFGLIFMICISTILTEGAVWNKEVVFGSILWILAGCGWVFQDAILGEKE